MISLKTGPNAGLIRMCIAEKLSYLNSECLSWDAEEDLCSCPVAANSLCWNLHDSFMNNTLWLATTASLCEGLKQVTITLLDSQMYDKLAVDHNMGSLHIESKRGSEIQVKRYQYAIWCCPSGWSHWIIPTEIEILYGSLQELWQVCWHHLD